MKKVNCIILAIVAILVVTCSNPSTVVKDNPLQGAWVINSTKYVTPDTTVVNTQFENPTIKLLTKKHFAFGNQVGENKIWGGGGEYTIEGNNYIEDVKYHGASEGVGQTVKYQYELKGDLWTITRSF